jgi:hypothetical protein
MREILAENVAWRRQGVRRYYVGTLLAGDDGILLTGRDPVSGVEVALSIPLAELQDVRVGDSVEELFAGGRSVVLELAESEPIFLREVGMGTPHVHVLARSLGALTHVPAVAQGGLR